MEGGVDGICSTYSSLSIQHEALYVKYIISQSISHSFPGFISQQGQSRNTLWIKRGYDISDLPPDYAWYVNSILEVW